MDRIRLLHVDDDEALRDLAASALQREDDIEVVSETGPDAALDRLATGSFDCVVSDYEMPGIDGLQFLRAVREGHDDLPFILFTGKGSEEIASEAVSAGVDDYIQKQGGIEQFELLANRVRNLVDRRRAERERAESERQLATLMDNVPGMAYRCLNEPEWPMEFVSAGCEPLTGYMPEQLESGEVVWAKDVIHPDDAGDLWEPVQEALAAREPFEVTYRIRTADGETKWCWERGRGVYESGAPGDDAGSADGGGAGSADGVGAGSADGVGAGSAGGTTGGDSDDPIENVVALEGFISDVTERKRVERELRALNEKVSDLHGAARRIHDADRAAEVWERAVEAAESVLEFEMCDVAEVVDDHFIVRAASSAISPEDAERRPVGEGIAGETYRTGEGILVEDTEQASNADPEYAAVRSGISVPVGDVGVFQAVSTEPAAFDEDDLELATLLMDHVAAAVERVRSAAELREERDRFAALFEQVPDPAVVATYGDDSPVVEAVNSAFEETFGYDAATIEGEHLNEYIVPEDRREEGAEIDAQVIGGEQVEREVRRRTADGELRDFLFRSVTVDGDQPIGFGVYTDVTERNRYEAELERQNERLDAFARVVSHDLRTPLNVAAGHLDLAAEEGASTHVETAAEAVDRMEQLVDDVLALARSDEAVDPEPVSLSAVASRVWNALDTGDARLLVGDELDRRVLADEDALVRLLENLFRNAVEHGSTDGETTGRTGDPGDESADADAVTVQLGWNEEGADDSGFYVADDGPGIPEAERERVFEQGVSLEESGTGVGLAVVRRVARAHGWSVHVENDGIDGSAGGGARFVFTGVDHQ